MLPEAAAYEICELCNWEDDGQGDADAHIVRGGPNGEYSLAEARTNFPRFLVMYRPGHDMRVTGPDTDIEIGAKRRLIAAFDQLRTEATPAAISEIAARVREEELVLYAELERTLRDYEAKGSGDGSA